MRKLLTWLFAVLVVLATTGCAFVTVMGDGNILHTELFDMSYRTGVKPESPMPLLEQVTTNPALKRLELPEKPMWLTDLAPKKEPASQPADRKPPEP